MSDDIKAISISATIAGHSRRADKSLSIRLNTLLEAPIEMATWLDRRKDQQVEVMIADDPEAHPTDYRGKTVNGKTPSQRLRNGIYRYWRHQCDQRQTDLTFEAFYEQEMATLIQQY